MTAEEFVLIHADITTATGATQQGLVNVNTASEAVLACIPGIGLANAATLAAYRVTHPDVLTSFAWLTQVLPPEAIRQAGRYITELWRERADLQDLLPGIHLDRGQRDRLLLRSRRPPRVVG